MDVLIGGSGNDRVTVLEGDRAVGGSGSDTLILSIPSVATEQVFALNFSRIGGRHAVDVGYAGIKAGQFEKVNLSLFEAGSGTSVTGSKGDDTIYVSGPSGGVVVRGGAGGDSITVTGGTTEGGWIDGGSGDDRIQGPGNGSTLTGGRGSDLFVLFQPDTADTISDFGRKDLLLIQRDSGFENLDRINVLVSGADPVATSSQGQFLYDTDDGRLMFDPDGVGAQAAIHVVTLGNHYALKATNFLIDF
jgi:Ca2+-binding RTX toxin-like protein